MKPIRLLLIAATVLLGFAFLPVVAFAQSGTPASISGFLTPELVQGLVTVITPLVIAGIKKLIPGIKGVYLPFAAPVVGLVATLASNYAGGPEVHWLAGAVAGALGLWLREAADQLKKAVPQ